MKYRVMHKTSYFGQQPVSIGHNQAWLEPREVQHQRVESFSLKISPTPSTRSQQRDYFGNPVTLFSFNEGYESLHVTGTSFVTVLPRPSLQDESVISQSPAWESVAEAAGRHATTESFKAFEFVFRSPRVNWSDEVREYARVSFTPGRPILQALSELTRRVHQDFAYDPRATTVTTPVLEVFKIRRGVCQDFAHLQIAMLRSLGIPARYVSGYLRTYPPEGKPRLVGSDASHAWLAVYCDPLGWVDVDPTNDKFTSTDHITLAWGRDYSDVPPLTGVFIGGGHTRLAVEVDVLPLTTGASVP